MSGMQRMRSPTWVANSGESEATRYSYFVFCAVVLLVVNWASTCANHKSGSDGQYGGSLRLRVATAPAACAGGIKWNIWQEHP